MYRLILAGIGCFFLFTLFNACMPAAYYRDVEGGEIKKDSIDYTGVIEGRSLPKIDSARLLARVRVRDVTGNTMDCSYRDMLRVALGKSRYIGGNLLLVTEKKQYQTKSRCFRVIGDIYAVPSLEGLEAQISWHAKRPLMAGDLRGKRPANPEKFPPIHASFTCKTLGNYYKSVTLRSETFFWTDDTYAPDDTAQRGFALRRAQVHFDLAEVHARRLKSKLVAFGRDLPAITSQCRPLTEKQLAEYKQQAKSLDAELEASHDLESVLQRWENQIRGELAATEQYWTDQLIDLRKEKKQ